MQMNLEDIQGLVARGHSDLPAANYLNLEILNPALAREWLKSTLDLVTAAHHKPSKRRLQIAFTYSGLAKLGLSTEVVEDYRPEFVQGMATEYRARLLGDIGASAAENWEWGGPNNPNLDILLCLFAINEDELKAFSKQLTEGFAPFQIILQHRLDTHANEFGKEHFGFRDGISQPILPGLGKKGSPGNPEVAIGEFVMGYPNAYNELPDSPRIAAALDPENILAAHHAQNGFVDLGANGTYLVFRQLRQDVGNFWSFLKEAVQKENPEAKSEDAIALAAKMVGRWPSGAPLACAASQDDESLFEENNFLYHDDDPNGFKCPVGSHVRRANPRDALQGSKKTKAMKVSSRHRILRRGRNFGQPLVANFDPNELAKAEEDGMIRGLHFICLNTNIARQFEFVQHTWSDNTKFEGMYDDPDPILGIKDSRNKALTHDFTIPQLPVRRKIQGLQRHVHVMGGAYFFMPGISALKFLAYFSPNPEANVI